MEKTNPTTHPVTVTRDELILRMMKAKNIIIKGIAPQTAYVLAMANRFADMAGDEMKRTMRLNWNLRQVDLAVVEKFELFASELEKKNSNTHEA